jgi:hypothetical protein
MYSFMFIVLLVIGGASEHKWILPLFVGVGMLCSLLSQICATGAFVAVSLVLGLGLCIIGIVFMSSYSLLVIEEKDPARLALVFYPENQATY